MARDRLSRRSIGLARTLRLLAVLGLVAAAPGRAQAGPDSGRRQAYLAQLRRILPSVPAWEAWLDSSRELPPDFDAMPSTPGLPDPLRRPTGSGASISAAE